MRSVYDDQFLQVIRVGRGKRPRKRASPVVSHQKDSIVLPEMIRERANVFDQDLAAVLLQFHWFL